MLQRIIYFTIGITIGALMAINAYEKKLKQIKKGFGYMYNIQDRRLSIFTGVNGEQIFFDSAVRVSEHYFDSAVKASNQIK